jgi:hypothetical protein
MCQFTVTVSANATSVSPNVYFFDFTLPIARGVAFVTDGAQGSGVSSEIEPVGFEDDATWIQPGVVKSISGTTNQARWVAATENGSISARTFTLSVFFQYTLA